MDLRQFRQVVACRRARHWCGSYQIISITGSASTTATPDSGKTTLCRHWWAIPSPCGKSNSALPRFQGHGTGMIHGESGTGKELAARALHALRSARRSGRGHAVNCGAIPEICSKPSSCVPARAPTRCHADRPGYFQAARAARLFWTKSVTCPCHASQAAARHPQERKIRPLGSAEEEAVDVRIVGATTATWVRKLQTATSARTCSTVSTSLKFDCRAAQTSRRSGLAVPGTAAESFAHESGLDTPELDEPSRPDRTAPLPGNVRELENVLHRAIALGDAGPLRLPTSALNSRLIVRSLCPPRPGLLHSCANLGTGCSQRLPATLPEDLQGWLDGGAEDCWSVRCRTTAFNRRPRRPDSASACARFATASSDWASICLPIAENTTVTLPDSMPSQQAPGAMVAGWYPAAHHLPSPTSVPAP